MSFTMKCDKCGAEQKVDENTFEVFYPTVSGSEVLRVDFDVICKNQDCDNSYDVEKQFY